MTRPPARPVPFSIPRTASLSLRGAGGKYRVHLAWPDSPAPPAGFPVIYLLDGSTSFGTLVEGLRLRSRRADATGVQPGVVVAIDQAEPGRERLQRSTDFTPWPAADRALVDGDPIGQAAAGGASSFLDLLTNDVASLVRRELPVPIDPDRLGLFGHSMAGLFVLHVLLTRGTLFSSYAAISPSIWWNREALRHAIEAPRPGAADRAARPRLLIAAAEYDQVLAPWQRGSAAAEAIATRRQARHVVDDVRWMAGQLSGRIADVELEVFTGEDHASVVARGLGHYLRLALAHPQK